MKKNIHVIVIVLLGFGLGVWVGVRYADRYLPLRSAEVKSAEVSPEGRVSIPRKPRPTFAPRVSNSAEIAPETDAARSGATGREPTPQERDAFKELARRSRAGEYLLPSDNPHMVRLQREHVKQGIEKVVPSIVAARQDFLSTLGVDEKTIARLTNHAARIAEASLTIGPLLGETALAKIEYDLEARKSLTPEQYEMFKEFEVRLALEREWKRFEVGSLENLSFNDLKAITRSMEELGIREKNPSTMLPYEPEPSSGHINAQEMNEVMLTKISKVDEAAANLGQMAERNQLSEEARRVLASMIENRARSLREQADNIARSDEEHRAWLRSVAPPHQPLPPDRK